MLRMTSSEILVWGFRNIWMLHITAKVRKMKFWIEMLYLLLAEARSEQQVRNLSWVSLLNIIDLVYPLDTISHLQSKHVVSKSTLIDPVMSKSSIRFNPLLCQSQVYDSARVFDLTLLCRSQVYTSALLWRSLLFDSFQLCWSRLCIRFRPITSKSSIRFNAVMSKSIICFNPIMSKSSVQNVLH